MNKNVPDSFRHPASRGRVPRNLLALAATLLALSAFSQGGHAQSADKLTAAFGAVGEESSPARRQSWRVPSADEATPSHALLYRPAGNGPFRLALIAHASSQSPIVRAQMRMPDYGGLVAHFVARGYAVLVPLRPGHGATGGRYLEDQGGCVDPDYVRAGERIADSILAALTFMLTQSFIRHDGAVILGHSAGGWGALALAARQPKGVARLIVFAPGRGGRAEGMANSVCADERLIAAAERFGRGAILPVTWIVAENDSYFSPALSKTMADAFTRGGAPSLKVDLRVLPPFGRDGHGLAEAATLRDGLANLLK